MNKSINIALVDDHTILLDGMDAMLSVQENLDVIMKYSAGEDLLESKKLDQIDLLIMDVNMKGKDGIDIYKGLKHTNFGGKCIFLSSYDDLKLVNEAINLGANGYVTKASASKYLHEAISTVCTNNQTYYSPDIKERILRAFTNADTARVEEESNEQGLIRQLTEREKDVLRLIAMQFTSDEIAKKLYIAKSTVDTHRKNLINKLKVKNAVGLGLFAERNSLI